MHANRLCSALIVHKLFVSKAVSLPCDLRKVEVNRSYLYLQSAAEHKGHANRTNVVILDLEMVPPIRAFCDTVIRKKCTVTVSQDLNAHQTPFCKCT